MKCQICGDPITAGDVVIGLIEGNAEFDEDNNLTVDVVEETKTAHKSCWMDAGKGF